MTDQPHGEVFEGHSSEMRGETPWLSSEDLLGRGEQTVEIVACHRYRDVTFEEGRTEPTIYTLQFKGKSKQLVLNKVNRKKLVEMYGPNVKEWAGKSIKLYVDAKVRFRGKTVCGIRIK